MHWNPRNPIPVSSYIIDNVDHDQTTKFELAIETKISVASSFFFNLNIKYKLI